jgi:hypothetical protein
MELVETALFTSFFDFVKIKIGINYNISPLEAARANLKAQRDSVRISILDLLWFYRKKLEKSYLNWILKQDSLKIYLSNGSNILYFMCALSQF